MVKLKVELRNEIEDLIKEIRPSDYWKIREKCKNEGFARTILWMNLDLRKKTNDGLTYPVITTGELARFMRYSIQRARYVLQEMISFELVKQLEEGKKNKYIYIFTNGKAKINDYIDECKKTLNLKLKIEQKDL